MKNRLFPFLALLTILNQSCGTKNKTETQAKSFPISMNGIDSLKLGMSKAQLETLFDTSFKLKHIKIDGGAYDTIHTKYKGAKVTLYLEEEDDTMIAKLHSVQSDDAAGKTSVGIGVGSDKETVIDAYADFRKYIAPEYEKEPVRSKTRFFVAVMDTVESRAILFHIVNKKVSSIEVTKYYEFY